MEASGQLHYLSALTQGKSPRGWLGSTSDLVAYEKILILLLLLRTASPVRNTRSDAYCLMGYDAV
jgi:hypothetical protein